MLACIDKQSLRQTLTTLKVTQLQAPDMTVIPHEGRQQQMNTSTVDCVKACRALTTGTRYSQNQIRQPSCCRIPFAAACMAATTSGMLTVLSSQLRENTLTLVSGSRCICALVPSYLYSARKGSPFNCLMASGIPSLIFASIGFKGTPVAIYAILKVV